MLNLEGEVFDKFVDLVVVKLYLRKLLDKSYYFEIVFVVVEGGMLIWCVLMWFKFIVCVLSEDYIDDYVVVCGEVLLMIVGVY